MTRSRLLYLLFVLGGLLLWFWHKVDVKGRGVSVDATASMQNAPARSSSTATTESLNHKVTTAALPDSGHSVPVYTHPPPGYKYIKMPRSYDVHITSKMADALERFDPDFIIWNSSDYPVEITAFYGFSFHKSSAVTINGGIGDFNGDGEMDAVVAGHDSKYEMLLALISTQEANGYSYEVLPVCVTESGKYLKDTGRETYASCVGLPGPSWNKTFIGKPQVFIHEIIKKGNCFKNECEDEMDCYNFCLKRDAFETYGIDYPQNKANSPGIPDLGVRDLFRWNSSSGKNKGEGFIRYGIE